MIIAGKLIKRYNTGSPPTIPIIMNTKMLDNVIYHSSKDVLL